MDFAKYPEFLDEFLGRIAKIGIDVSDLEMDHIAYRSETFDSFEQLTKDCEKLGSLEKQTIVRGQKVNVYKLYKPWTYKNRKISVLELVSPKQGDTVVPRFEHAEFVIKEGFVEFMKKYPNVEWDTSPMNAADFPMIKLKMGDDMQVKFHLENILEIIKKVAY